MQFVLSAEGSAFSCCSSLLWLSDAAHMENTEANIDPLANDLSHQTRSWQQLESSEKLRRTSPGTMLSWRTFCRIHKGWC